MKVVHTLFLFGMLSCSSLAFAVELDDAVSKYPDVKYHSAQIALNDNKPSTLKTSYIDAFGDLTELKILKRDLSSVKLISHTGTQDDFIKTFEIRGYVDNIRHPTATIELTATW